MPAAAALVVLTVAAAPAHADGPSGGPSMPDEPIVVQSPDGATDALLGEPGTKSDATPEPAVDVALKLRRDGSLAITETITVAAGSELTSRVPLRVPARDDQRRVYRVSGVRSSGAGTAVVSDGELVIHAGAGKTTVTFTVAGAVADTGGGKELRWRLVDGFDVDLASVHASFILPTRGTSSVTCTVGGAEPDRPCDLAGTDHTGVLRVEQDNVAANSRVALAVALPAGAAPANARFERVRTFANSFSLTKPSGIAFGALAALLLAGAVYVLAARRRDANAANTAPEPIEMVQRSGGNTVFASPDGLLPGQIGTVVDETVDVVDLTATVVDLAVRNYVWLAEVTGPDGGGDWQLSVRNPPDGHLRAFEHAVLRALLPRDSSTMLLSQLRAEGALALDTAREAMYAEVVSQRWFSGRPDTARNRMTAAGAGIAGLGVCATFVLAVTTGHALIGVAGTLAGLTGVLGSMWLPTRTRRGRVLVDQVRGLLDYLSAAEPNDIPASDREMVFSRCLPYAVVLGAAERWLETFADVDPAADGAAGVYWFGGLGNGTDLRWFASRLRVFLAELDGVLAESGHLRSIRTPG